MKGSILIIEDDPKITAAIKLYLEREGYRVSAVGDGREGLEMARAMSPSLIILDLMLPEIGGLEVCRILQTESNIPIIMLTARVAEQDKIHGLNSGADDYVTKPFSPRELMARVGAVLRRRKIEDAAKLPVLRFNGITVDLEKREIKVRENPVDLTPSEFKLLEVFARSPDRAFTRDELVERAFGFDYDGFDRTIDAHIMNLRKKIEPNRMQPTFIVTVFGIGYKFAGEQQ